MKFADMTYRGPAFDDRELLSELPAELARLLLEDNGFVAYRGGLHVRGACRSPTWHSLRHAWRGPDSIASKYPSAQAHMIPFAQDAVGDQYLWDAGSIVRLSAETGDIEMLGLTLEQFLAAVQVDATSVLAMAPLLEFEREGGRMQPGQLLNVYPPFVARTDLPRAYKAVPIDERLDLLAELAAQLRDVPDGGVIQFRII